MGDGGRLTEGHYRGAVAGLKGGQSVGGAIRNFRKDLADAPAYVQQEEKVEGAGVLFKIDDFTLLAFIGNLKIRSLQIYYWCVGAAMIDIGPSLRLN